GVCDGVVVRSIHEPLSGKHSFQDGLSVVQTIPINEDSCQVRLGKDAIGMSLWNTRVDANGILRVSLRLHKVVCPNEGVREVHEYDADAWIVGASQTLDDLVGGVQMRLRLLHIAAEHLESRQVDKQSGILLGACVRHSLRHLQGLRERAVGLFVTSRLTLRDSESREHGADRSVAGLELSVDFEGFFQERKR